MFTDSHSHVYREYYDDIDLVVKEAEQNKVNRIITCGCSDKENKEVLEIIKRYSNIYGALGIHPENVLNYKSEDLEFIKLNIANKKILAIGEIGLDYYYSKDYKQEQINLLEDQLKIAEEYDIPVIIHSREATQDTLDVLKKYNVKGIIHSFSGSFEVAQEYIKMGYLIGINGVITFKNSNVKDVIKKLPLNKIVLETDSPYLTPHPHRGEKNSPKYVLLIAEFVADLFDITLSELANITNDNLHSLFDKLN